MSHVLPRAQRPAFEGIPTVSSIAIVGAALFTGALLSVHAGQISWPFLALFTIAALSCATLVNPRGLFLTVAFIPLLFVVAALATGWGIAASTSAALSRADALVIAYPVLQLFPVLAAATLGALIIAAVRYSLLRRHNAAIARAERAERRRIARSNRRTRERTLSVEEILARVERDQR
ncbi:DUF6542 domain-containing protein [Corynebacterium liangguodongii]|uniref:Uncharacterized protein n=1 Tax=Corynebacterium liangguodongii TaxID=2079535 RepID=A0A2S0WD96_9CORY|nr:DUF6542 domain-containing protein [Corynebacterium liangguodongii]AWB83743.1 hypothetical protein C3E79_03950 [Corynebacterium liangguodongii]PWB99447.1 hypothetical protein DF219_05845 [Corynebacterium liangguodongii]